MGRSPFPLLVLRSTKAVRQAFTSSTRGCLLKEDPFPGLTDFRRPRLRFPFGGHIQVSPSALNA